MIDVSGRPWTTNEERRGSHHWSVTREQTRNCRRLWELETLNRARGVRFNRVAIDVHSWMRQPLPDTGNIYPYVKAAIDGIVDARLIPGDTHRHVASITMHATTPIAPREREHVTIVVRRATT